jgi:hypothetical protein
VEEDLESYDEPTIRLVIAVAHPEYGPGLVDWVYFVREPITGTGSFDEPFGKSFDKLRTPLRAWLRTMPFDELRTGQVPVWHHYQRDSWDAACGKDEGPLTWATGRLLQGDLGAVGVYAGPLPGEFLELVAELGGWRLERLYLPVVSRD